MSIEPARFWSNSPADPTDATTSPLASSATMMATETFGPMALARSAASPITAGCGRRWNPWRAGPASRS